MIVKKFKWFMVSIACVIVCVFSIINQYSVQRLTYSLIVVGIVFLIIGSVIQHVLDQSIVEVNGSKKKLSKTKEIEIPSETEQAVETPQSTETE